MYLLNLLWQQCLYCPRAIISLLSRDLKQSVWEKHKSSEEENTIGRCKQYLLHSLQLETPSRAVHGGAYFSTVSGWTFNQITFLRSCRPLACCWMFFSRPLSLLYWISLNCQVPWGWHCIFRWICLQNAKMDLSRAIFFICSTYPPIPNCFALKIRVTF